MNTANIATTATTTTAATTPTTISRTFGRRYQSTQSSSSREAMKTTHQQATTTSTNGSGNGAAVGGPGTVTAASSMWTKLGVFALVSAPIAYALTRPLVEGDEVQGQTDGGGGRQPAEPLHFAELPAWQLPWKRAYYRCMNVYKKMIDPEDSELLPDPFPPQHPLYRPYTLVIELDKVLVHSKWDREKGWSVAKRPWADYFLAHMSRFYEVVVFTEQNPYVCRGLRGGGRAV